MLCLTFDCFVHIDNTSFCYNMVAAFQGMHVSPAKRSYA